MQEALESPERDGRMALCKVQRNHVHCTAFKETTQRRVIIEHALAFATCLSLQLCLLFSIVQLRWGEGKRDTSPASALEGAPGSLSFSPMQKEQLVRDAAKITQVE